MDTRTPPHAVVVGVDGSLPSELALRWAAARADDTGSPLLVVHAAGDMPIASEIANREELRRLALTSGRKLAGHAADLARAVAPDITIEVQTHLGDPRELLLQLSEEAALLVVGTRGRGTVRSLLLGSVSTALVCHAQCPVVVVRDEKPEEEHRRPVIAGVDGGPSTGAVLGLAFDLAESQGRALEVVHCWQPQGSVRDRRAHATWLRELSEQERSLDEAMAQHAARHPDVHVRREVVDEAPVSTLVDRSAEAGLLVVGSRGLSWARSVIGSVSRAVVERALCTVVVVRQ